MTLKTALNLAKIIALVILSIIIGLPLYAIPATLSLAAGRRPGIEALTLSQAARRLRETGMKGWVLVEATRRLVAERMQYCRRNSFDPASKAFERGYGYCQQQAYALVDLLTRLGFEARVVQSFRSRFPDGSVGGHAWVSVTVNDESRYFDTIHYDSQAGKLDFTPLTPIRNYTPITRLFYGWGCIAVNAHRYYLTGKDE